MIRVGRTYLYSMRILISRGSNERVASRSRRLFSLSMYAWMSSSERCSSLPFSCVRKHTGVAQLGLYCIRSAIGRLVFVPPPTCSKLTSTSAIKPDKSIDGSQMYLIKLKTHQSFNQSTLAAGLMTHNDHGRGIKRFLKILSQRVKRIVGFI